jgi:heme-degrading monooxygenase HmoA
MHAVVNHLHLNKPVDEVRNSLEAEGLPLLASQPGFENFYFVKVDDSHAIVIIIWASAADAQNGAQQFGPTWFAKNIAPYLASDQQRSMGEVIVRHAL